MTTHRLLLPLLFVMVLLYPSCVKSNMDFIPDAYEVKDKEIIEQTWFRTVRSDDDPALSKAMHEKGEYRLYDVKGIHLLAKKLKGKIKEDDSSHCIPAFIYKRNGNKLELNEIIGLHDWILSKPNGIVTAEAGHHMKIVIADNKTLVASFVSAFNAKRIPVSETPIVMTSDFSETTLQSGDPDTYNRSLSVNGAVMVIENGRLSCRVASVVNADKPGKSKDRGTWNSSESSPYVSSNLRLRFLLSETRYTGIAVPVETVVIEPLKGLSPGKQYTDITLQGTLPSNHNPAYSFALVILEENIANTWTVRDWMNIEFGVAVRAGKAVIDESPRFPISLVFLKLNAATDFSTIERSKASLATMLAIRTDHCPDDFVRAYHELIRALNTGIQHAEATAGWGGFMLGFARGLEDPLAFQKIRTETSQVIRAIENAFLEVRLCARRYGAF